MRHDQLPCGIQVIVLAETARQLDLILLRQQRKTIHSLDIAIQTTADHYWQCIVCRHYFILFIFNSSTLIIRVPKTGKVPAGAVRSWHNKTYKTATWAPLRAARCCGWQQARHRANRAWRPSQRGPCWGRNRGSRAETM